MTRRIAGARWPFWAALSLTVGYQMVGTDFAWRWPL